MSGTICELNRPNVRDEPPFNMQIATDRPCLAKFVRGTLSANMANTIKLTLVCIW